MQIVSLNVYLPVKRLFQGNTEEEEEEEEEDTGVCV
jgi:hypothetical protein